MLTVDHPLGRILATCEGVSADRRTIAFTERLHIRVGRRQTGTE
jgi:hypothetical protein